MSKPPFVMSKYSSLEDLYDDKAAYWLKMADAFAERLIELEEVSYCSRTGIYRWTATGDEVV